MVRILSSNNQRSTGSTGDWSRGELRASSKAPLMGSPTEKRKEPRTKWPSIVETFFQATVYVPSGRGFRPTNIAVPSAGSTRLSPSSTLAPWESRTRMSLRSGSMGSVNQMATRVGASSSTESGEGAERA